MNATLKIVVCVIIFLHCANVVAGTLFNSYHFFQKNYVSLNYQNTQQQGKALLFSFHDHDPRFGNTNFHTHFYYNPLQQVKERYQQIQLYANYYINRQLSVQAVLPYLASIRFFEEREPYQLNGVGDARLGAKYHFYNSQLFHPQASIQNISTFGLQGKFKTGKFNIANEMNDIDPYLQPGTGSFDLSGTLSHRIIFNKFNLYTEFNYIHKGISYYQMKFGNQFNFNIQAERKILDKTTSNISLLAQLSYQQKKVDKLEDRIIQRPNSYKGLQFDAGTMAFYKKLTIELQSSFPVYYQYDDFGMHFKPAFFIQFSYCFNDTSATLTHLNNNKLKN